MSFFQKKGIVPVSSPDDTPSGAPEKIGMPDFVVLPLSYGGEMLPVVSPGGYLKAGQPFARAVNGFTGISPFSGSIGDIRGIRHPFLGSVPAAALLISPGSETSREEIPPDFNPGAFTPEQIISSAMVRGITDETDMEHLGVKLSRAREQGAVLLLADAAEDEPFSGAALSVLTANTREVLTGLELAAAACGATKTAIALFMRAGSPPPDPDITGIELVYFGPQYPCAPEKKRFLEKNRAVAVGVQALAALARAVALNEGQTEAVVSVGGNLPEKPSNLRASFGTPLKALIAHCKIHYPSYSVVAGGSLRGKLCSPETPLSPGITALLPVEDKPAQRSTRCIDCSSCCEVCPSGLLPIHIMKTFRSGNLGLLVHLNPGLCTGCGCCSYVCPSRLELTQSVRRAAQAVSDRRDNEGGLEK